MKRHALVTLVAMVALAAPTHAGPPALKGDSVERAARAAELTIRLDFDEARKVLAEGDADSGLLAIERARLALYEGDCDGAVAILARPELAGSEASPSGAGEAVAVLSDVARGCARATAATVVDKDDAQGVVVRYQDEDDRALTPLLVQTVVRARDALTRDLGVTWPKPTRITVVRDLMSLSAMTGLAKEAAMTTGTVAVAKWGRVTLLSPRASRHGYAWRDTVAHELTHLAVTRATADRAPLWLQEGVAKREEVRWRDPGPFDDRPPVDAVVEKGIDLKLDLPLDQLGPSIAMLPSADAAMVAFAEVTSFVRYLVDSQPPGTLPRLFVELRAGKANGSGAVDEALRAATGDDLKAWDVKWRAHLLEDRKARGPEAKNPLGLAFDAPHGKLRDVRERVRLAELLYGREHPRAALVELDKIPGAPTASGTAGTGEFAADPSIRHLRARVLEALGTVEEAAPLLADPKAVSASFGPWWAIRGRTARDPAIADPSFVEAVAADPLDVEPACRTLDPATLPEDAVARLLCDAARKMGEPPLGRD
jgi:hypothetical protein